MTAQATCTFFSELGKKKLGLTLYESVSVQDAVRLHGESVCEVQDN